MTREITSLENLYLPSQGIKYLLVTVSLERRQEQSSSWSSIPPKLLGNSNRNILSVACWKYLTNSTKSVDFAKKQCGLGRGFLSDFNPAAQQAETKDMYFASTFSSKYLKNCKRTENQSHHNKNYMPKLICSDSFEYQVVVRLALAHRSKKMLKQLKESVTKLHHRKAFVHHYTTFSGEDPFPQALEKLEHLIDLY
eukprot:snap_masked-scaffold_9-processed-gene-11.37-mRNA-1 protein AED:1.00 eAED:1.00 QI:0/0/0/0/1/1/2/0/195